MKTSQKRKKRKEHTLLLRRVSSGLQLRWLWIVIMFYFYFQITSNCYCLFDEKQGMETASELSVGKGAATFHWPNSRCMSSTFNCYCYMYEVDFHSILLYSMSENCMVFHELSFHSFLIQVFVIQIGSWKNFLYLLA